MSDPQEAATPSDPHSAEAPVWRDAWRTFQDPYLYPDAEKFPSPFESFVAGFMAAHAARDAEVAELKAKIADAVARLNAASIPPMMTEAQFNATTITDARRILLGSASSPVEGGN